MPLWGGLLISGLVRLFGGAEIVAYDDGGLSILPHNRILSEAFFSVQGFRHSFAERFQDNHAFLRGRAVQDDFHDAPASFVHKLYNS